VAAESGHAVVLHEQLDELGGQLRVAAAGPTRGELLDFVSYLDRELQRLGVEIRLASEATAENVVADAPDLVVCAGGATPEAPAFPVTGGGRVVTVWDLLSGSLAEVPARALVVDDGSGFWHSISAAEYLAERGARVELVTPSPGVALAIPHESARNVAQRLGAHGVRTRVLVRVVAVAGERVTLTEGFGAEPADTEADVVVVRTELLANDGLARALEGADTAVTTIGDATAPRRLNHAVLDANLAIRAFDAGRLGSTAFALS